MSRRLPITAAAAFLTTVAGTATAQIGFEPTPTTAPTPGVQRAHAKPQFELVSAGAEEARSQLRLAPTPGTIEQFELAMSLTVALTEGPQRTAEQTDGDAAAELIADEQRMSIPVMLSGRCMVLQHELDMIMAGFELTGAEIHPKAEATLAQRTAAAMAGEQLIGMMVVLELEDAGVVVSSRLLYPDNPGAIAEEHADEFLRLVRESIVALPTQPVGVDAVWATTETVTMHGASIERTTTCTLESFVDGVARLEVATSTSARDEVVYATDMPGAAEVRLVSQDGVGEGAWEVRMDRLLPQRARLTETTERSFSTLFRGASEPLETTVDSEIAFELRSRIMQQADAIK